MNEPIITKIKDGKITLQKDLQKEWGTTDVVFVRDDDGVYVKPITPISLEALASRLRKLGKLVPSKTINEAVKWAKQKTYASRV